MKNFLVSRKLEEDYTEAELNHAETCPEHATDSNVNKSIIENTADKVSRDGDGIEQLDIISEAAQMRLRIATFETIVADNNLKTGSINSSALGVRSSLVRFG